VGHDLLEGIPQHGEPSGSSYSLPTFFTHILIHRIERVYSKKIIPIQ